MLKLRERANREYFKVYFGQVEKESKKAWTFARVKCTGDNMAESINV